MRTMYSMIRNVMQLFRIQHGDHAYRTVKDRPVKWENEPENWYTVREKR